MKHTAAGLLLFILFTVVEISTLERIPSHRRSLFRNAFFSSNPQTTSSASDVSIAHVGVVEGPGMDDVCSTLVIVDANVGTKVINVMLLFTEFRF